MEITEKAKEYIQGREPVCSEELRKKDPEFYERFWNFAFDEVISQKEAELDDRTRSMVILSVIIGCQGIEAFSDLLPGLLRSTLFPVEVKPHMTKSHVLPTAIK